LTIKENQKLEENRIVIKTIPVSNKLNQEAIVIPRFSLEI
jgi:hypothetical protein